VLNLYTVKSVAQGDLSEDELIGFSKEELAELKRDQVIFDSMQKFFKGRQENKGTRHRDISQFHDESFENLTSHVVEKTGGATLETELEKSAGLKPGLSKEARNKAIEKKLDEKREAIIKREIAAKRCKDKKECAEKLKHLILSLNQDDHGSAHGDSIHRITTLSQSAKKAAQISGKKYAKRLIREAKANPSQFKNTPEDKVAPNIDMLRSEVYWKLTNKKSGVLTKMKKSWQYKRALRLALKNKKLLSGKNSLQKMLRQGVAKDIQKVLSKENYTEKDLARAISSTSQAAVNRVQKEEERNKIRSVSSNLSAAERQEAIKKIKEESKKATAARLKKYKGSEGKKFTQMSAKCMKAGSWCEQKRSEDGKKWVENSAKGKDPGDIFTDSSEFINYTFEQGMRSQSINGLIKDIEGNGDFNKSTDAKIKGSNPHAETIKTLKQWKKSGEQLSQKNSQEYGEVDPSKAGSALKLFQRRKNSKGEVIGSTMARPLSKRQRNFKQKRAPVRAPSAIK